MSPDKKMMLEKMLMGADSPSASGPMAPEASGGGENPMLKAKIAALMQMLQSIEAEMSGGVKSEMDGMKKVSVMAPDQAGLEKGLEVAADVADEIPMTDEETVEHADEMPVGEEEIPAEETAVEDVPVEDDEESDDGGLFYKGKKRF